MPTRSTNARLVGALSALTTLASTTTLFADAATDIKVKKPNVLLLLDTSGSMAWSLDGSNDYSCNTATNAKKPRWTVLLETLTGTVNNLTCYNNKGSYIMAASNTCRPYPNLNPAVTSGLNSDPFTWPRRNGTAKDSDAVSFCGPTSNSYSRCTGATSWNQASHCVEGPGGWDQKNDGLIDTYANKLRFGVASFDSLDLIPSNHQFAALRYDPLNTPAGCQYGVDGSRCSLTYTDTSGVTRTTASDPQWSYWGRAPSESWMSPVPGLAHLSFTSKVYTDSGERFLETPYDIGIRNSRAAPARGRLIGFGPSDWDLTNTSLPCASEDDCTRLHNQMVERSILGVSNYLEHSTPLAAMMRDAYEFVHLDTTTTGVHVPLSPTLPPLKEGALFGTIAPQTDPYFSGGARCRSTAVVVVTDGEPTNDLDTPMSYWAGRLNDEEAVKTFVVGVGLDSAKWSQDGLTAKTQDCSLLGPGDLTDNGSTFCARDSATGKWKFADKTPYSKVSGVTPGAIRACCTLLETAVEGGTSRPFFPKDQNSLKQELNQVLQTIAGGSVSRTVPVFGNVTSSFATGSTKAPANGYELRSSMEVSGDGSLWRGHLERVRYTCDAGSSEPVAAIVDNQKVDPCDSNLDTSTPTFKRRILTVAPRIADHASGTLRASKNDPNGFDGLGPSGSGDFVRLSGDASTGKDALVATDQVATVIDGLSGAAKIAAIMGLKSSDATSCGSQTGSTTLSTCADRIVRWYGGDADPDGAQSIAPSRSAKSAQCTQGVCSPMGAIYRSSPIVVSPPTQADSDVSAYGRTRTNGSDSFVDLYGARPTMTYAQTVDGQLHAFVLSKNDYSGADFDSKVPDADSLANNELWTFIPPAVMPALWPNFNTHARLLDGQLTWANLIYDRPASVDVTDFKYATVIVGASGPSSAGGFYYAVDVTDPLKPKFLWQLRTAGNGPSGAPGDALFGGNAPGATITSVRYRAQGSSDVKNLAVAVLPGGTPTAGAPTTVTTRREDPTSHWRGTNRTPRNRIRDWGKNSSVPARSLTIVELETGRILARLTGSTADNPRDPSKPADLTATSLSTKSVVPTINTPFDSPITGIPVAYPGGIGVPATRIYVGDADGTLWRVDLNGPDIDKWTARIAFDGYNRGMAGNATLADAWVPAGAGFGARLALTPTEDEAALLGEPIETAPLLSLDGSGNLVVAFATGEQESFNSVASGMVNVLISFAEEYVDDKLLYQPKLDGKTGVEMAWKDGGRVTGPVNLHDGQLYFAYFNPSTTLACTNGTGGVCGFDYLERNANGSPTPYVSLDGNASPDSCVDFTDGEVVFGVAVNQIPSCSGGLLPTSDPWLGGTYNTRTTSKVGRTQLVFQTGQGGESESGAQTKSTRIPLPPARTRTRVRAWITMTE